LLEPNSRALHDQRAHQARIVEPPGEGECKRDTRDDAGDDEQQRATPAALQGLQILLQFLLDALTLSGALRIVDSFDLREQLRIERVVQRQPRRRELQALIERSQLVGTGATRCAVSQVSLQCCCGSRIQIAVEPILQAIVPRELVLVRV